MHRQIKQHSITVAKVINNMRLTSKAREKINENLALSSLDLGISPLTINHWAKKRQHLFLRKPALEVLKKYVGTDDMNELFEFESEKEKNTLLKKYYVQ